MKLKIETASRGRRISRYEKESTMLIPNPDADNFDVTYEGATRVFKFRSKAEYERALDWYNDPNRSKSEMIAYYVEHDTGPIGEIWEDADCSVLADDWAYIIMEMWAKNNRPKPYQVETTSNGCFYIVTPAGSPCHTTAGAPYVTQEIASANEAAAYLNQAREPGAKRVGAHWLQSTFGVF